MGISLLVVGGGIGGISFLAGGPSFLSFFEDGGVFDQVNDYWIDAVSNPESRMQSLWSGVVLLARNPFPLVLLVSTAAAALIAYELLDVYVEKRYHDRPSCPLSPNRHSGFKHVLAHLVCPRLEHHDRDDCERGDDGYPIGILYYRLLRSKASRWRRQRGSQPGSKRHTPEDGKPPG